MAPNDAFDLTPELQAAARATMDAFRTGPLYTPPSLEGSLVRPSGAGVANWGRGAFDSEDGDALRQIVERRGRAAADEVRPGDDEQPFSRTSPSARPRRRWPTAPTRAASSVLVATGSSASQEPVAFATP